jgi:hypothetical protein
MSDELHSSIHKHPLPERAVESRNKINAADVAFV